MPKLPFEERRSLAAGILAITATYFVFLLFAEFAFLELVSSGLGDPSAVRLAMALLGAGGLTGSFLAARLHTPERFPALLANAFRGTAFATLSAVILHDSALIHVVAFALGLCMGLLTVTLACGLGLVFLPARFGLCVGLGTGLAYALCNVPFLFDASPRHQGLLAGLVAILASRLPSLLRLAPAPAPAAGDWSPRVSWIWILVLAALIWLDSAAFYIIQHAAPLKSGTWSGSSVLWSNAATHFLAALLSGFLLDRGLRLVPVLGAFLCLAFACILLGNDGGNPLLSRILYTTGVSLYSTLLVWYAARGSRPWLVACLFAFAGWVGSALGIGMAQNLACVPDWFLFASALVLGFAFVWRRRFLALAVLLPALFLLASRPASAAPAAPALNDEQALINEGREVYIAEGCLHCHSQFVRARVPADLEQWGPATPLPLDKAPGEPPLPGNRRQGPDLANVGNRRNAQWQALHLRDPRAVFPGSRMPSYAALFSPPDSRRGQALVAYLGSLGASTTAERQAFIAAWSPENSAETRQTAASKRPPQADGPRLFKALCAPCHGADAKGAGPLAASLGTKPADLTRRPYARIPSDAAGQPERLGLLRLIKFGVQGTSMAGHEYLSNAELEALASHLRSLK